MVINFTIERLIIVIKISATQRKPLQNLREPVKMNSKLKLFEAPKNLIFTAEGLTFIYAI